MSLHHRVALVTGSSRGIGRAVALRLAAAGCKVAVNYLRGASDATEVVERILATGMEAVAVKADVSDAKAVEELVKISEEALGGIDILVNNAGIARDALLVRLGEEDWDRVVDTDLKGAYLCMRAVARGMIRRRWGRIVNMASVVGLIGSPGQVNYAAAKAGLLGLTRAAARELATRGITINAVAPGYIETEMWSSVREDVKADLLHRIPVGRAGRTEEVAEAVAFLVSEEAAYITGQVLAVDGGLVMA